MCDICEMTPEDRRDAYEFRANQLKHFAEKIRQLGFGKINPHTMEATDIGIEAKSIIRFLVEDWL